MSSLTSLSISELIPALQRGDFSSRELTEAYLARIEALEPSLKACITLEPALALEQADAADQKLAELRCSTNDRPPEQKAKNLILRTENKWFAGTRSFASLRMTRIKIKLTEY